MPLLIIILSVFIPILASTANLPLTKSDLLSGSQVPEKRPFPLSSKISACQDFHAYVCNEVETSFKLPEDRNHWVFSFTDAAERLLFAKKTYFKKLEKMAPSANPRSQQLKDFYLSCMNPKAQAKDEKFWVEKQKAEILKIKTREAFIKFNNSRLDSNLFSLVAFDITANQDDPKNFDFILVSHLMNLPENSYYENKALLLDFKKVIEMLLNY